MPTFVMSVLLCHRCLRSEIKRVLICNSKPVVLVFVPCTRARTLMFRKRVRLATPAFCHAHTHTHNTGIHNTHTCVPCTCKCCTHLPPVHTQPLLCMHSVQDMHVIKVEGGPPSARSAHAAVVVHDRYIVMFGGVQLFA